MKGGGWLCDQFGEKKKKEREDGRERGWPDRRRPSDDGQWRLTGQQRSQGEGDGWGTEVEVEGSWSDKSVL